MKILKWLFFTLLILLAVYFVIGFIFFHFALNANNTQSRTIGEQQYVPSASINTDREILEREKDRQFTTELQPIVHTFTSYDGLNLQAYEYVQANSTNEWIFAVHGYTGSARQMTRWSRKMYELGYNVFAPDLRGHGSSEGNYYGMGWLDEPDLKEWLNILVTMHPDAKITLYGVSMGASAVLNLSSENIPEQIDTIVADSAFSSVHSIFKTQLKALLKLPSFPVMNAANTVSKLKIDLDFKEASTVDRVKKSKLPIYYIHGNEDSFVPISNAYDLVNATKSMYDLWVVENANHGDAIKIYPDEYPANIDNFIQSYRK